MSSQEYTKVSDYLGKRDRSSYVKPFSKAASVDYLTHLRMISAFDDHVELTLSADSKAKYTSAMNSSTLPVDWKDDLSKAYREFEESLEKVMPTLVNQSQESVNIASFEKGKNIDYDPLLQTWGDLYCRGPGATHLQNRDNLLKMLDNLPNSNIRSGDTSDGSQFLDFYSSKG